VATLILTLALRFVLDQLFELHLENRYWYRDYIGNLVVSLICFALTASSWRAMLLSGIIITGFQLSNAGKLVVLGTPISPDDFINMRNLFLLWKGWLLWAMVATLALPVLVFIWFVRWRHLTTWLSLGMVTGVVMYGFFYSAEVRSSLDKQFGNSVWNQPENYKRRGLALHIAQESVRTLAKVKQIPVQADIDALMPPPVLSPTLIQAADRRNVHMIVLESFFDPNSLGKEWVPEDPLPANFTALWDATGRSTALSPVFGGYTANAEFEALCGFPVTENAVFFEGWLRRDAPCLPDMLRQNGYRAVTSHPNVAGFWNRTHAYRLTGFDTYWSKSEFDTSDAVGNFVLDHSYYDQVFDKLQEVGDAPVFNYMLTLHGHLPYPTNERYPDRVSTGKESGLLQGYLNHIYYKSRDLMALLDKLRQDDPTALIVAFGDHLPFLGPNYDVYTDIGKMMPDRENFTPDMFEFLSSTPLIVIDGERGPLQLGQLPLYRLPSLIMELLGSDSGGIADWTLNPAEKVIRPIYGMHFYLQHGKSFTCRPEDIALPECVESEAWMDRVKVLSADIFSGKQFSLRPPISP
jgi:phosphoglycerol transferase MdoB-like AlkP superfamily enzyme